MDPERETTVSSLGSRGGSPMDMQRETKMASTRAAKTFSSMHSRKVATRGKMAVKPLTAEKASTVKAWGRADSYVRSVIVDLVFSTPFLFFVFISPFWDIAGSGDIGCPVVLQTIEA